jgi:hypothetical protein
MGLDNRWHFTFFARRNFNEGRFNFTFPHLIMIVFFNLISTEELPIIT